MSTNGHASAPAKKAQAIKSKYINPAEWPLSFGSRVVTELYWQSSYYFVLFLLEFVDAFIIVFNFVGTPRRQGHVVPDSFSPSNPPPLGKQPITWLLCKMAHTLGRKRTPDWIWYWANWQGVGHRGKWGEAHEPSLAEVSRSPCPALNALANHGILPYDGRKLSPFQLSAAISRAYNLSPTLATQLVYPFRALWQGRGWLDLEDLGAQNVIAHDGSMTREDINSPYLRQDEDWVVAGQAKPSQRLIEKYFPDNGEPYTIKDLSRSLAHARAASAASNGQYNLSFGQYLLGSGNTALIHKVMGEDRGEIRPWVGAGGFERIVEGFEPKTRDALGLTIIVTQTWTLVCEMGAGPLPGTRMEGWIDSDEKRDEVAQLEQEAIEQINGGGNWPASQKL